MSFERQGKLSDPTFLSNDIANKAMELFKANYRWDNPIRSLGVRGSDLVTADTHVQLDLFDNSNLDAEILAGTVDMLHKRFGHYSIQRCAMLLDRHLTGFNPEQDHVIHPISYFK
jgi:DNA polymerase-4